MADSGGGYASSGHIAELHASLARLHMRYSGGRDPASTPKRADLQAVYKDKTNIRSKYKGARTAAAVADDAAPATKTSGVPVFGIEGAADRAGWSKGHVAARQAMSRRLGGVATENSHALGHADFGTDHELSAPAATKAQNTEQLAIELSMRTAAHQLNTQAGLADGTSLLHAKITDVLHPQTGDLVARRYKLIRRAHKDDHDGTVVFDHIMDGERTHISKDDAMALGQHVHRSVMTGAPVARATFRGAADPKGPMDRKGLVAGAPKLEDIAGHQAGVLATLNTARGRSPAERTVNRMKGTPDRTGVPMVGPAFTDAAFPATAAAAGDGGVATGQTALDTLRGRMAAGSAGAISPNSLLVSGSLPADNETKLRTALARMGETHGVHMTAGAAAAAHVGHGMETELGADVQAGIGASLGVPDPVSTDDSNWQFIDQTGKAVKAMRRMEADQSGSGVAALKKANFPLEHLLAAHARRNQYIGGTGALVPVVPEDDVDEVDKRDADEARGSLAAEAPASPPAPLLARSLSQPATPLLARAGSLPLMLQRGGADRRGRDEEMGEDHGASLASTAAAGAGLDDDMALGGGGGSLLAEGDTRGGKSMRRDLADDNAGGAGRVSLARPADTDMAEEEET